ncbi:hypothetical protein EBU71_08155, partial [bacterium]|nr:hypothetical protein [Candidatus Elulimicrobium humile]
WEGMPSVDRWVSEQIAEIRKFTDRKIIVRSHPRSPLKHIPADCTYEQPQIIPNTYDDFNFRLDYHCIVNHNSGVGVHCGISGVPVIVDSSSLAKPIGCSYDNITTPSEQDRRDWFLRICHTEWTLDEIKDGIPLKRLMVDFL